MTCNCNKCQGVKTYSKDVGSKGLINDIELVTPDYFDNTGFRPVNEGNFFGEPDTSFDVDPTQGGTQSPYATNILGPLGGIVDPTQRVISDLGGYENVIQIIDQVYVELGPLVEKNPAKWPYVHERIVSERGITKITPVEFGQFVVDTGYASDPIVIGQSISYDSDNFLDLLNEFLGGGTGAIVLGILGALCNLPENPFGKLLDLFEGGFEGLASKLKSFVQGVKQAIDEVVEGIKKKVDNLVKSFQSKFEKIRDTLQGGLIKRLQKRISTAYADFKALFSKENIDNLKKKVEQKAQSFFNAFKDKKNIAEVLDYLLALLCGMKTEVDQALNEPMNAFKQMVDKTELVHDALKKHSDVKTLESVSAGREYAEPSALRENCRSFAANHNNAVGFTGTSNAGANEISNRLVEDLQRDFDLTREQAAGIAGNLYHESNGFSNLQEINPVVSGSRGGYGYAQWTGPRRREFEAYAASNGLAPDSYEANYGFLKTELEGPEGRNVLPQLKLTDNVGAATQVFSEKFLRPGIPHMESRVADAQSVYDNQTASDTSGREGKGIWQPQLFNHPDPGAWSNLSFNTNNILNNPFWTRDYDVNMKDYGGGIVNVKELGYPTDIGYYGTRLDVLERLNEVGKQLGHKFTINSAFRPKVYNQDLINRGKGAAVGSKHISGIALDVAKTGWSQSAFVAKCRAIGFGGIGYYNSFIHVDTGAVRSWG